MESFEHLIRVEAGSPSPEELAAVVAVLSVAVAEANEQAAKAVSQPRSTWNRSASMLRGQVNPGLRQWNASFRPGLD
jgi:hypothetical protein